jgi:hypothetical protein
MSRSDRSSALPYRDAKPVGAAGFTFAINATFRFIERRLGIEALRRYWIELGRDYGRPVSEDWKRGGLPAVAAYWRAFFAAEPEAEVEVIESDQCVSINVMTCPAIHALRQAGREITPCFCQHCYFQEEAMARAAGLTMRLSGGNGRCRHRFQPTHPDIPEQDLAAIKEATC